MSYLSMMQEHGAEAAQAAGHGAEEAAEAASHGLGSIAEIPQFISHHLEDSRQFEFAGMHFDLNALAFDPIHIGGMTVDLSPTRQLDRKSVV